MGKSISFRFEEELLYKLRYIADFEGRTMNGQVIYLVKQAVREFEKEHGTISSKNDDE